MFAFHLFLGFFASLYYSIRTGHWKPFWCATIVGVPVAIFYLAAISTASSDVSGAIALLSVLGFIPPLMSFLMFSSKANEMRVRRKIADPIEADMMIYQALSGKASSRP
ncbi:hypothetical protein [Cyanobium sp. NS01]|uniref:hypothetical protein n=1 Tax=Cyanobium sp. NS01 TaxID=261284 RepID=UPI001645852E|nr:hypothetical protein [Cyanobium sp. NS01]